MYDDGSHCTLFEVEIDGRSNVLDGSSSWMVTSDVWLSSAAMNGRTASHRMSIPSAYLEKTDAT